MRHITSSLLTQYGEDFFDSYSPEEEELSIEEEEAVEELSYLMESIREETQAMIARIPSERTPSWLE